VTVEAGQLNDLYLQTMPNRATLTLGRVWDLWWPAFLEHVEKHGACFTLDRLDIFMEAGRDRLIEMAAEDAATKAEAGSDRYRLVVNQFLKANTGKMFERFVGLALAYCLKEVDSPYCIQPFTDPALRRGLGIDRSQFMVDFKFGDGTLMTPIDADLFAFNPTDKNAEIFMISVKSTLKDRFHNVPFWNLLRRVAISADFPDVEARNFDTLDRVRYVAVCSDLAQEQPDFATDRGARNLLQIDAALLDGAYVTASRARGLPEDCKDHIGDIRQHAFYRYSCFYRYLTASCE
jgi:hypothetical protein